MITNIRIRDFKGLEDVKLKLDAAPFVLIGPNNCGKTSVLQALTMWHHGVDQWCRHPNWRQKPGNRPRGFSIPVNEFSTLVSSYAKEIWRGKKIIGSWGGTDNERVKIRVDVSGQSDEGEDWDINVEFTYRSPKVVSCTPAVDQNGGGESSADIAKRWRRHLPRMAFLQPMSGMSGMEEEVSPGAINRRLGRGETANVLRNICHQLLHPRDETDESVLAQRREYWEELTEIVRRKFSVNLGEPMLDRANGLVVMQYGEDGKGGYDLSSGGRGFHQTLLLLAYLYSNPNSVILLDEPDAHLETRRQRDNFSVYYEVAEKIGSQLIMASHSEVVMREAAVYGDVVSILSGNAAPLVSRESRDQFQKWLRSHDFEIFRLAKQSEYVIFLEGKTDINMLAAFAEILYGEKEADMIRLANIVPVNSNDTGWAKNLFRGLRGHVPNLRGYALFDNVADEKLHDGELTMDCWRRMEVENYLLLPDVLRDHAQNSESGGKEGGFPLVMEGAIGDVTPRIALNNPKHNFWREDMKKYIRDVFAEFHKRIKFGSWRDSQCYTLVQHMRGKVPPEVESEVREKILALLKVIDPEFNPGEKQ